MTLTAPAVQSPQTYRFTALGSGLLRMWRSWKVIVPVVVINAIAQSLLVWTGVLPGLTPGFILLAVVSYLVFVVSLTLILAALLESSGGAMSLSTVRDRARRSLPRMLLWSTLLLLGTVVGLVLYIVPALILWALTPFVLIAAVDGQRNPLSANLRVIGRRWGRWLVTCTVMGVIGALLWLLGALDGFFVTGALGALIGWVVLGLVVSWFSCAWVLIYRAR
jgi:hypothetical protein